MSKYIDKIWEEQLRRKAFEATGMELEELSDEEIRDVFRNTVTATGNIKAALVLKREVFDELDNEE